MGTSRNDRSPSNPAWKPALAVLGRPDIKPERQLQEIWRSAYGERGERLIGEFAHPSLPEACRLLTTKTVQMQEALTRFEDVSSREVGTSFAVELGKRALARCIAASATPTRFVQELFAEATSYYASRDLPSYVGAKGRVETVAQSIALKDALKNIAMTVAGTVGEPRLDTAGWTRHVAQVITTLRSVTK